MEEEKCQNPQKKKTVSEDQEARISNLPVDLLIIIISLISESETRYAIRTSSLSKQWKYLWAGVPNLIFISSIANEKRLSDFISSIDKTLTQFRLHDIVLAINKTLENKSGIDEILTQWRQLNLFEVGSSIDKTLTQCPQLNESEIDKIRTQWRQLNLSDIISSIDKILTICPRLNQSDIVSSINKTLIEVTRTKFKLCIPYDVRYASQVNNWVRYAFSCKVQDLDLLLKSRKDFASGFVLDQFFFSNSSFTRLNLGGCVIDPTGTISWSQLKSLYISKGVLGDDLIKNILSGCPLLETLGLTECYGYSRLDIPSESVKRLVITGYMGGYRDQIVEINAPHVLSLTIQYKLYLSKLLLLDVSSVAEAKLDYQHGETTHYRHDETTHRKERDEMFKAFILKLLNVEELTIGSYCKEVFTRLRDEDHIFPPNINYLRWSPPRTRDYLLEDEEHDDDAFE